MFEFYIFEIWVVMAQKDTAERILDAAEALFSEKGFAETSLRNITTKASVNLAAVNYHFGSKKELIKAVMSRYMNELSPRLESALIQVCDGDKPTLVEVFYFILLSIFL